MRLTWEQGILKSIEREPSRKVFQYSFPRQMGATTFLVLHANLMTHLGKKTAFVAHNQNALMRIRNSGIQDLEGMYPILFADKGIDLYTSHNLVLPDSVDLRSKTYDWIYVDNGSFCQNKTALAGSLMSAIGTNGHILWIDTQ